MVVFAIVVIIVAIVIIASINTDSLFAFRTLD